MRSEWQTRELGEVAELHDSLHRTPAYAEDGYPMIRVTDIRRGYVNTEGAMRVDYSTFLEFSQKHRAMRGDILFSRVGSYGNSAYVIKDEELCLGQNTVCISTDRSVVDPFFLYSTLNSDTVRHQVQALVGGASQGTISLKSIRRILIPMPPLTLQRRIAGILSAYDDLIENNQRRIKILEEMARSLYREWFVKFHFPGHEKAKMVPSRLGPIPQGWEVNKLKDVCHLTMGQSPKSEFYNDTGEGQPFHQGVTNFGDRFPMDRLFCTVEGRLAEAGDILFSVRAPVGRMNIADKKIIIGRGLSAIRHKDGHQAFLWEQLRNRFTKDDMMGNGAIFAAVTKNDMQGIEIVCPPEPIVREVTNHFSPLHTQTATLSEQTSNLRRTRDLLLPRLISGKARVETVDTLARRVNH